MTVLRPTIKGHKVSSAPILEISVLSSKQLKSSSLLLACDITQAVKTNHPCISGSLVPSETAHTLSMEYVSLYINLLSLYCGWFLNSFPCHAKDLHQAASPRDSFETWKMTLHLCPFFFPASLGDKCWQSNGSQWLGLANQRLKRLSRSSGSTSLMVRRNHLVKHAWVESQWIWILSLACPIF